MVAIMQALATAPSALPSDSSALDASISALKSSISALESSLKTLEGSSAPWELLAIISSFVVFFGIVGEVIVIVSEDREDREDWARGVVRPPDRAPRWRFWFDIVATIVVLLGVLGEAWGSSRLASINSQLRSKTSVLRAKSDQLLALVTEEAGEAKNSAVKAQGAAKDAQSSADKADKDADKAKLKAEAVARQAVDLARNLREIGAEEAELQKSIIPRDFNQIDVAKKLKPVAGPTAFIETIPDFECERTAALISSALVLAHWNVQPVKVRFDTDALDDFFFSGIEIHPNCLSTGKREDFSTVEACFNSESTLFRVLTDAGLRNVRSSWPEPSIPFNSLLIRIGLRTIPGEQHKGTLFIGNDPKNPTAIIQGPSTTETTKPKPQ